MFIKWLQMDLNLVSSSTRSFIYLFAIFKKMEDISESMEDISESIDIADFGLLVMSTLGFKNRMSLMLRCIRCCLATYTLQS